MQIVLQSLAGSEHPSQGAPPTGNRDARQLEHSQREESPSKTLKRKVTREGSETPSPDRSWWGSTTQTKLELPGFLGSLLGWVSVVPSADLS